MQETLNLNTFLSLLLSFTSSFPYLTPLGGFVGGGGVAISPITEMPDEKQRTRLNEGDATLCSYVPDNSDGKLRIADCTKENKKCTKRHMMQ